MFFIERGAPLCPVAVARNLLFANRLTKFRPLPLLYARFICHRHANPKTHFVRFEDPCAALANVPTSISLHTISLWITLWGSIPHRARKCKGMAQHSRKKRRNYSASSGSAFNPCNSFMKVSTSLNSRYTDAKRT